MALVTELNNTEWSSNGSKMNNYIIKELHLYVVITFVHFSYEPELFPGLIYRIVKPRMVLLIFVQ